MQLDMRGTIEAGAKIIRDLETKGLTVEQTNVPADEWPKIVAAAELMYRKIKLLGFVAVDAATEDELTVLRDLKKKGITIEQTTYKGPPDDPLQTYEDVLWECVLALIHKSIGGSPWTDEVEVALICFQKQLEQTIRDNRVIAEILGELVPDPAA